MQINRPDVVAEMQAMFARYERALMGNDVEDLVLLFWQSPLTLRYGVGEQLHGIEAIAAFRAGRAAGAPGRVLHRTEITTFGEDFATANTEFQRENTTRIGRQSQTWVRFAEGWRITSAHVSLNAAAT
jgi:hypothetical protein